MTNTANQSTFPIIKFSNKNSLALAISIALTAPLCSQAATFNVTEPLDDGTGLVTNTLSWAILQSNTSAGADIIELNTDVTVTGVMKRLIDSDTTVQSGTTRRTIDGNNQFRPLFIKSGQVTIQDLDIQNGQAKGGDASVGFRAGKGAGLGGAMFIYDGTVNLENIGINNSIAVGGDNNGFGEGGGGMFGQSNSGGGGLFADAINSSGAYGGYGNYQNNDAAFGQGGNFVFGLVGHGGFGGGGGYGYYDAGGDGGFGAGGGYAYYNNGGDGGFGGGGGFSEYYSNGVPGYGAELNNAAGFGGGLFIRSGSVIVNDVVFDGNQALKTGTGPAESAGFGGGLFVLHTLNNSNANNQGMPAVLPMVSGCGVVFTNNSADTDPATTNNNDDVFDLANLIIPDNGNSISDPCGPPNAEILVSGNSIEITDGDITPDSNDFTAMGLAQVSGQNITNSFEITNIGNLPLLLSGNPVIELQNNSGQFSITAQPQNTMLNNGDVVGFDITFAPTVEGVDTVTVVIQNNDTDEAPYDFLIEAEGTAQTAVLQVLGNGIEIQPSDETPEEADNTAFGFTPVTNGMIEKTFEIKNTGFAPLNLSDVQLFQSNADFTITQNITDTSLDNDESTFVTVQLDPANSGFSSFTAFEVYDDNFNLLHYHVISGYGQPSLLINANNNYLQEGETASFTVTTDVLTNDTLDFTYQVTGQVDAQDFPFGIPSGFGFVDSTSPTYPISFQTVMDGVYEGPEFFSVVLESNDPRLALGFPSVSGGVIDDDLIFNDGFNPADLSQVLAAIATFAIDSDGLPHCDFESCNFLSRSMDLSNNHQWQMTEVVTWFEETLVLMQPNGDWDGDGLPNHHDLNPFALNQSLLINN